jgi:hypothetical protein
MDVYRNTNLKSASCVTSGVVCSLSISLRRNVCYCRT